MFRSGRPHIKGGTALTLETTRPAAQNFLQQQAKFDDFVGYCNAERPPPALAMRCPAELYTPSPRPYGSTASSPRSAWSAISRNSGWKNSA
jgi:hypothetical protein